MSKKIHTIISKKKSMQVCKIELFSILILNIGIPSKFLEIENKYSQNTYTNTILFSFQSVFFNLCSYFKCIFSGFQ